MIATPNGPTTRLRMSLPSGSRTDGATMYSSPSASATLPTGPVFGRPEDCRRYDRQADRPDDRETRWNDQRQAPDQAADEHLVETGPDDARGESADDRSRKRQPGEPEAAEQEDAADDRAQEEWPTSWPQHVRRLDQLHAFIVAAAGPSANDSIGSGRSGRLGHGPPRSPPYYPRSGVGPAPIRRWSLRVRAWPVGNPYHSDPPLSPACLASTG